MDNLPSKGRGRLIDYSQGTGCVTLAAIMAGLKITGTRLTDMRMVVFGSGSAGCGIAAQVQAAIAAESGKSQEEVASQIYCIDRQGLLVSSDDSLSIAQKPFARKSSEWEGKDTKSLEAVIAEVKPSVRKYSPFHANGVGIAGVRVSQV